MKSAHQPRNRFRSKLKSLTHRSRSENARSTPPSQVEAETNGGRVLRTISTNIERAGFAPEIRGRSPLLRNVVVLCFVVCFGGFGLRLCFCCCVCVFCFLVVFVLFCCLFIVCCFCVFVGFLMFCRSQKMGPKNDQRAFQ